MIKRHYFIAALAIAAGAKAVEIQPAGGQLNRARIHFTATFEADAQDFFTRGESNGGTYSATTKAAVNTFVVSAKANGYWDKLNRINLFCGDQLAAALVPLKVGGGSPTDANNNFVGGDYSEATGLTGNGTTKYLNTGLLANALTLNDTHLAVYNRSSTNAQGGECGAVAGGNRIEIAPPFTDGKVYSQHYDLTGGALVTASAIPTPFGFLLSTRTAADSHVIYRNGSSIANNATTGGTLPAQAIYIFALNNNGAPASYMASPLAAYSIGSGLTGANVTNYNTDLEAFQDALGRGVIGAYTYLRPGGVDTYRRPGGVDLYLRP